MRWPLLWNADLPMSQKYFALRPVIFTFFSHDQYISPHHQKISPLSHIDIYAPIVGLSASCIKTLAL